MLERPGILAVMSSEAVGVDWRLIRPHRKSVIKEDTPEAQDYAKCLWQGGEYVRTGRLSSFSRVSKRFIE